MQPRNQMSHVVDWTVAPGLMSLDAGDLPRNFRPHELHLEAEADGKPVDDVYVTDILFGGKSQMLHAGGLGVPVAVFSVTGVKFDFDDPDGQVTLKVRNTSADPVRIHGFLRA